MTGLEDEMFSLLEICFSFSQLMIDLSLTSSTVVNKLRFLGSINIMVFMMNSLLMKDKVSSQLF